MRCAAALLALSVAALAAPDTKVELGRRLFFDRTASRTGRVSCSSCHDPEHGFSDPRALSEDEWGRTTRKSQALLDLDGRRSFHWDGEFESVRELLTFRFEPIGGGVRLARATRERGFKEAKTAGRKPDEGSFNMMLHGCGPYPFPLGLDRAPGGKLNWAPREVALVHRLAEDDRYAPLFTAAFGLRTATTERVLDALEAYVLSLRSGTSPFDRHLAGDPRALDDAQRKGLALFTGKANCAACHTATGERPTFTDLGFHNTGVAVRPMPLFEPPDIGGPKLVVVRRDFGNLMGPISLWDRWFRDWGRGDISFVKEDRSAFRTPSLRDVARRGPFMHDGSLATLEDVVRFYDRGGFWSPHLDRRLRPLGLTDEERGDLVAFLRALTSDERPGVGAAPARDKMRVRVTDLLGKPIRGLRVEILPAGDRLMGGRLDDPPDLAVTDDEGRIAFGFPGWTHVQLTSETHEIHYDWPIPDCAPPMEVMAAPRDKVALKLRTAIGSTPEEVVACWAGTDEAITRFRRVRTLGRDVSLYVAKRRRAAYPWVSAVLRNGNAMEHGWRSAPRELDLSGGWTDPVDDRPDPLAKRR